MVNKYFSVQITPDIINGDVSDIIGNQVPAATDNPIDNNGLLFDWMAIDVPKGVNMLRSVSAYIMGEDGATQNAASFTLVFAKTIDNVAPGTLGDTGAVQSACFELPKHYIGCVKLGGANNEGSFPGVFGRMYTSTSGADSDGVAGYGTPLVLPLEDSSGTNVGYDKLYVAGFSEGGMDFSTGVKPTAQATTSTATMAVDGVDPRKCFQIGDTVYTNTDDTALGTVKSMASDSIVLNANLAAQVEDNEEIVNANPIRITLGFER